MDGFKGKYRVLFAGAAVFTLVFFQNCAKTNFSADDVQSLASKDPDGEVMIPPPKEQSTPVIPDDANKAPPEEGDPLQAYSGPCSDFKDQTYPLEIPASSNNVDMNLKLGSYDIGAANNVTIKKVLGHVVIDSAQSVSADDIAGYFLIRKANVVTNVSTAVVGVKVSANSIQNVRNLAGLTCLHAHDIGTISRVASGTKIIASTVQKISDFVGVVRVYGAEINQVDDFVGVLCLYNGAKVLNKNNVVGVIRKCD